MKNYKKLLEEKEFQLNSYPEGRFWELIVTDSEKRKLEICRAFGAIIDLDVNGTDINTLILQCAEDFTKCVFYYDCNPFDVETNEFMQCVEKLTFKKYNWRYFIVLNNKNDLNNIVESSETPNGLPLCQDFSVAINFKTPEELNKWVSENTSLSVENEDYHIERYYLRV